MTVMANNNQHRPFFNNEKQQHEFNTLGFTSLHGESKLAPPVNYITIEANIAAGKSTFITNNFKDSFNCMIIPEPIEQWRTYHGKNLLDLYYKDPLTYGFQFQECVHETFNEAIGRVSSATRIVTERSLLSTKKIFSPLMHTAGYLTDNQLNDLQTRPTVRVVGCCIYLYIEPDVALQRMKLRDRLEERTITLSYLEQIHNLHNSWLIDSNPGFPVIVVDASRPYDDLMYRDVAFFAENFF